MSCNHYCTKVCALGHTTTLQQTNKSERRDKEYVSTTEHTRPTLTTRRREGHRCAQKNTTEVHTQTQHTIRDKGVYTQTNTKRCMQTNHRENKGIVRVGRRKRKNKGSGWLRLLPISTSSMIFMEAFPVGSYTQVNTTERTLNLALMPVLSPG